MNIFTIILESVGLKYNPEIHSGSIPYSKKTKSTPAPKIADPKPEGRIVVNAGLTFDRQFLHTDTDNGFEEELIKGSSGHKHPSGLTASDRQVIRDRRLSESKAIAVKKYWSKGVSAKIAARSINQRGFGVRTLEKYWSAFNEASKIKRKTA